MDLIVLGSGAAGLTAALVASHRGLQVRVLEKTTLIGGTTAVSEGMVWAPLSRYAREAGVTDSDKAAIAYLLATSHGRGEPEKIAAYVENAARTVDFLADHTRATFTLARGSIDYYPDAEGASRGVRALNPGIFDARLLKRSDFARLRPPLPTMMLLGGLSVASGDVADYYAATRSPRSLARVARYVGRYARDRLSGWPRGTRIANGNGLVAALVHALTERGVSIETGVTVRRLLREGGRVTGVEVETDGGAQRIFARKGVILATGSFSRNPDMTARWFRHVGAGDPHRAVAPDGADGDGMQLGEAVGATIDADLSAPALWAPASAVPLPGGGTSFWPHFSDRAKPGVIVVDGQGCRFTNEAATYRDFVEAMLDHRGNQPDAQTFLIIDHGALRKYGLGPIGPSPVPLGRFLQSGYLKRGSTIRELAAAIGVDPDQLDRTVLAYNGPAALGQDPAFGKGVSDYDRGNGDASATLSRNVRPLDRGPYYAVALQPGDLGTFIGLRTDAGARVLDRSGAAVPGLFAAGNAAATMTGGNYPAAGLTIGAALTFGYIAARSAAE